MKIVYVYPINTSVTLLNIILETEIPGTFHVIVIEYN